MRRETAALLVGSTVLAATRLGARFSPAPNHPRTAAWYGGLEKPSYTPPGPVIGAAWSGLDLLLCVAGYRLLTAPPTRERTLAVGLWGVNVAGLAGWSFLFFGRKRVDESLAAVGAMLASAAGATITSAKVDGVAAASLAPLVAWLSFAGLLNGEIWRRNRPRRLAAARSGVSLARR